MKRWVVVLALASTGAASGGTRLALLVPPTGFVEINAGPAGGTVWQGLIPNRIVPTLRRPSAVYLPPHASPTHRYPVLYLLHGFRGSPSSYVYSLNFASFADAAITSGAAPPFIAVMPVAGKPAYDGEWAGPWERYLVRDVVPWTDALFPTVASRRSRALAGLSAGGYGAIDIGLRHPRLFGTLESWSGYFRPYRDGPLRYANRAELAAHDPTLLTTTEAPQLRRLGVRFFLSCGSTHDRGNLAFTLAFDRVLNGLGLRHRLWLGPGGHDGRFWRKQLPAALQYAFPQAA